ncbi:hypothetical protein CLOM_g19526 [Closterium sp. NIES-68]|nr:hypothetical protein CLOM_g15275 [Closterium sp. NIES-68]GJP35063.1 hypothetical protein CLOM_g19526 [Closterium sp. NIES-68]GJP86976.1 hypothetical protein CLOP_g16950 [Closterium sp. NIES-67]
MATTRRAAPSRATQLGSLAVYVALCLALASPGDAFRPTRYAHSTIRSRFPQRAARDVLISPLRLPSRDSNEQLTAIKHLNFSRSNSGPDARETRSSGSPGGISARLSESGLQSFRDVLVKEVLEEIIPLSIPDLQLRKDLPKPLGSLEVNLTDLILWNATIDDASIDLGVGDSGGEITVFSGRITANVSLTWSYAMAGGYVRDSGNASVQITGMQAGIAAQLQERFGGLWVSLLQRGAAIDAIEIHLTGSISWLYTVLVDLLPNHLRAAMEDAITGALDTVVNTANTALQALPRIVPIDGTAALDATLPADPTIDGQSISLACHGRFLPSTRDPTAAHAHAPADADADADASLPSTLAAAAAAAAADVSGWSLGGGESSKQDADVSNSGGVRVLQEGGVVSSRGGVEAGKGRGEGEREVAVDGGWGERGSEGGSVVGPAACVGEGDECGEAGQMVALSLSQHLVASASQVYYEAAALAHTIDHLPDSFPWKLLNTKGWRWILPRMFREYPDADLVFRVNASQPPNATLTPGGIGLEVDALLTVTVLPGKTWNQTDVIGVKMVAVCAGTATVEGNNITAAVQLVKFQAQEQWSLVGNIPTHILQAIVSALSRTVLIPLLNHRLRSGFPLPFPTGISLANSSVHYCHGRLLVCSDLVYRGGLFGKD